VDSLFAEINLTDKPSQVSELKRVVKYSQHFV